MFKPMVEEITAEGKEALKDEGFILSKVTGDEHPPTYLHDTLYGNTQRQPHAFVFEGYVLGTISGTESIEDAGLVEAIYGVVDAARRLQGRPPAYRPVY